MVKRGGSDLRSANERVPRRKKTSLLSLISYKSTDRVRKLIYFRLALAIKAVFLALTHEFYERSEVNRIQFIRKAFLGGRHDSKVATHHVTRYRAASGL